MKTLHLIVASLLLAAAPGCLSTQLVAAWRDPSVHRVSFNRVIAVAPHSDPAIRRAIEDRLVRELAPRTQAVPSYTLFSEEQLKDQDMLRDRIRALGFDGEVVFRIVSVDRYTTWVPGVYQGPYYAFGGWPLYDPGYLQTNTVVRVDTNIYSVPDNKLVWASTSNTLDPGSVPKLVHKVVKKVVKEMRKEGLVVAAR